MSEPGAKAAKDKHLTELALRAANGDREAFEEFWNDPEWQNIMDGICGWICRRFPGQADGHRDSEDLKHRAFQQAYKKLHTFKGKSSVGTWFRAIAFNINTREHDRSNGERIILQKHYWGATADQSDSNPYATIALKEAYDRLDPKQKNVFKLLLRGKAAVEIAEELNTTEWHLLSEDRKQKEVKKVYRIIEKTQRILVEAVEVRTTLVSNGV